MKVYHFGNGDADVTLVQMVDDHDLDGIETEYDLIRKGCPERNIHLIAVHVDDWNDDLSPWQGDPVFGDDGFGGKAEETLSFLLENVIHDATDNRCILYVGGYSLAGLFALWAVYNTDRFSGAAAASPSVWFPGFDKYMKEHQILTDSVYLSLGTKEEKTKNPVMARVGDAIRGAYELFKDRGINCILEWNPGNHFKEPEVRTANAFIWLINNK